MMAARCLGPGSFPAVSTADLDIHPRDGDLIVGTFGRSIWVLDDLRPFRELARTKGQVLEKDFAVFPAPDAYLTEFRSVDGARFIADAKFVGQNKPNGAMLTFWVKPPTETGKTDKKKPERVKIRVIDELGDTIRTFSTRLDTGMNRISWNLRRDGVRFPMAMNRWGGREEGDEGDLPPGLDVFPGTYKLIFSYKKSTDSTMLRVLPDPRIPYDMEMEKERHETAREFFTLVEKATKSFNQLKDLQKSLGLVNQNLTMAPDSTQKAFKDRSKAIADSLKTLTELYTSPEDQKGIQRNPDNISTYLFRTWRLLQESPKGSLNQMAQISRQRAEKMLTAALERISKFYETEWMSFQQDVEALQLSPFKAIEPVRMD